MSPLPDIEDLFPHLVRVKHNGDAPGVTLRIMKWLEGRKIMIHTDFYLDMSADPERVLVHFKKKKPAKLFKENKKAIRDEAEA
jgi:hypothetical protein